MLNDVVDAFLNHCDGVHFSERSRDVLSHRSGEFIGFLESLGEGDFSEVTYTHLSGYVTSGDPSVHVKKARVWFLHQFFHFLKLQGVVKTNSALKIPYPKMTQREPVHLLPGELSFVISYFIGRAGEPPYGLRDLVMILFFAFPGLRISSVIALNIQDIDLAHSRALVTGKGGKRRIMPLPQILCRFLGPYLESLEMDLGPLFQSKQGRRVSSRSVQYLFSAASEELGIHLHSHLFRHTAATQVNRVSGIDVAKEILGHRRRENTQSYVHLNPDVYAEYMARHPVMLRPEKEF